VLTKYWHSLRKNKDKKQAGELDFFFASACESAKRLPRHLQLKVKAEVMKAIIDAETENLKYEQFRSPTPSINGNAELLDSATYFH
jgi:hypothetical protein